MLKIKLSAYFLLTMLTGSFAQKADDLIGKYQLPNHLDVEIYKENGRYQGKIIALRDFEEGQKTDVHNPDKKLRSKPLIGMQIIFDLQYNPEDKQWLQGEMYGPEKGMTFHLKVTEMREKEIEVVGSKYFFWKTLIWKKIP